MPFVFFFCPSELLSWWCLKPILIEFCTSYFLVCRWTESMLWFSELSQRLPRCPTQPKQVAKMFCMLQHTEWNQLVRSASFKTVPLLFSETTALHADWAKPLSLSLSLCLCSKFPFIFTLCCLSSCFCTYFPNCCSYAWMTVQTTQPFRKLADYGSRQAIENGHTSLF